MSVRDFESWLGACDPAVRAPVVQKRKQESDAHANDVAEAARLTALKQRRTDIVDRDLVVARPTGNSDTIRRLAQESEDLVVAERVQAEVRAGAQAVAMRTEEARKAAERPVRRQHGAVVVDALVETMGGWLEMADTYLASYQEYRRCGGGSQDYPVPKDGLAREILKLVAQRRGVALNG
jgi:hypothetical protein